MTRLIGCSWNCSWPEVWPHRIGQWRLVRPICSRHFRRGIRHFVSLSGPWFRASKVKLTLKQLPVSEHDFLLTHVLASWPSHLTVRTIGTQQRTAAVVKPVCYIQNLPPSYPKYFYMLRERLYRVPCQRSRFLFALARFYPRDYVRIPSLEYVYISNASK